MQEVCGEAFKQSEALTQLLMKAEKEEAEMEALKKVNVASGYECSMKLFCMEVVKPFFHAGGK